MVAILSADGNEGIPERNRETVNAQYVQMYITVAFWNNTEQFVYTQCSRMENKAVSFLAWA